APAALLALHTCTFASPEHSPARFQQLQNTKRMPATADWAMLPADPEAAASASRDSIQALEIVAKDSLARASAQQQQQQEPWWGWLWRTANTHFLYLGAMLVGAAAAAYPPLGRSGGPLMPSLTTGT